MSVFVIKTLPKVEEEVEALKVKKKKKKNTEE